MKIRTKLYVNFGILILVIVGMTVFSIISINNLLEGNNNLFEHPYRVRVAALRVSNSIIKIHRTMKDVVLSDSHEETEASIALVNALEDAVNKDIQVIRENFLGEQSKVDEFEQLFNIWKPIREVVIHTVRRGEKEKAANITQGEGNVHVKKLDEAVDEFVSFAEERAVFFHNESVSISQILIGELLILLSLVIITIIITSLMVIRAILNPLYYLHRGTEIIGKGNLKHRIDIKSRDEIGQLAHSFNIMTEKLQESYKGLEMKVRKRTAQLAQAKARDDAMLENIGDGLVFTDLKRKIILANRAAQEMLGWREVDMMGKKWEEVTSVKNKDGEKITLNKLPIYHTLTSKKPTTTTTTTDSYYYTKKGGTTFPVATTVSKVSNNGKPIGVIIVFRDITRDKEIDKAKSEFVSLASHQLKTPPTSINWITERILAGKAGRLTEKQSEYFNDIRKTNQRMIELVNALLNVSRIELGAFAIRPTKKDVCDVVKNVIQELKPLIESRKLKVKEEYSEDRKEIMIDEPIFRMVVHNLVTNSIRYTSESGKINIECKFAKKGDVVGEKKMKEDSFVVIVKDTGCGVPKYQQDKLFTKFFRADNAKEKHTDGTGLGLYIVKSIIEHSNGSIWFSSEENKGTTFYVTIPASGMRQKEGTKPLVTP